MSNSPAPAPVLAMESTPALAPSTAIANAQSSAPANAPSLELANSPSPAVSAKQTLSETVSSSFSDVITKSNVVMLLWFMALYLVIYFIMGVFKPSNGSSTDRSTLLSRTFDFAVLLALIVMLISTFYFKSDTEKEQMVQDGFQKLLTFMDTPVSLFSIAMFILALYLSIYLIDIPMTYQSKPISVSIMESGAWILFVIAMIFTFFNSVMKISLKDVLTEWFDSLWNKDKKAKDAEKKVEKQEPKDEVFNIGDNLYTYEDAQTVCSSYGARLATYEEMEKAYEKGAEWCNYGWSDGQMAFFPTQKSTWDELQKTTEHKHSCGRPGVNGGYFANPHIRFGINCYGKKPQPSAAELVALKEKQQSPNAAIPKTEKDELIEKKIKYWKENGNKILKINSYNNKQWSAY